jgi:hypothetical protein
MRKDIVGIGIGIGIVQAQILTLQPEPAAEPKMLEDESTFL